MRHVILFLLLLSTAAAAQAEARLVGDLPRKVNKPLESLPGVETEYGAVRTSEGVRLRTIITRPTGAAARLPAIFFTQWVSCDSLELSANRTTMLGELAKRSGMVLIRVERAGTGDSGGPACSALDYDTEVRHYREAFDQLSRHPWVDPDRIFIFGNSLGSTTAPLVAQGKKVAGIVTQGAGAYTYLERMINFDRLYLERSGKYSPEQIQGEMVKRIAFHQLYLIGKKTPEQIERDHPELAGVWQSIRGGAEAPPHYGRPYAWHQQAADKNFLGAWAGLNVPILIAYSSYDQFEPRAAHKLIIDQVNRLRPGSATLLALNGLDHSLYRFADEYAAYKGVGGTPDFDVLIVPMIAWLKDQAAKR
jgi:pimeloyl-ACP methyl ester carboxylesterase